MFRPHVEGLAEARGGGAAGDDQVDVVLLQEVAQPVLGVLLRMQASRRAFCHHSSTGMPLCHCSTGMPSVTAAPGCPLSQQHWDDAALSLPDRLCSLMGAAHGYRLNRSDSGACIRASG